MARHRSDAPVTSPPVDLTAPDVDLPRPRTGRPHRYLDPERAEHSQELPVAPRRSRRRLEEPAGAAPGTDDLAPSPRTGGHDRAPRRGDPETTPLDLAAIALAAARTSTGSRRLPPLDGAAPGTGAHGLPVAGGAHPGPGAALSPSRTVGTLAVLGAVVGAGLAAAGGGAMLTAEPAVATVEAEIETTGAGR